MATDYAAARINTLHKRFMANEASGDHPLDEHTRTLSMARHLREHGLELFEHTEREQIEAIAANQFSAEAATAPLLARIGWASEMGDALVAARAAGIDDAEAMIAEEREVLGSHHPLNLERTLREEEAQLAHSPLFADRVVAGLTRFESPANSFAAELKHRADYRSACIAARADAGPAKRS